MVVAEEKVSAIGFSAVRTDGHLVRQNDVEAVAAILRSTVPPEALRDQLPPTAAPHQW